MTHTYTQSPHKNQQTIYTDTHLHTSFSSDSDASMESMVLQAIKLGLHTICFTEHLDFDYPDNPDHLDFSLDMEAYQKEFSILKKKYAPQIKLLFGVELGVQSHLADQLESFYEAYGQELDFIINSCHVIQHLDPYYDAIWQQYSPDEIVRIYFENILKNLQVFSHYQSAGHLDYILRYRPKPWQEFSYKEYGDILDAILEQLIKKEKSLEVNTAGLKYGLPWPNPNIEILKRYRELGGQLLTIGSDGHKPEHMAWDFAKIPEILSSVGFHSYQIYERQEAETIIF